MSSVTDTDETTSRRMSADERREQILLAAVAVFGARGYEGTTTDEVARAAGVSQPYVVRLFGSKESLFLAALNDAVDELMAAFRAELQRTAASDEPVTQRMGTAYLELLSVRGLHQTLSHAFLLGGHPVIGPAARACFARVWTFIREEAGMPAEEASVFLAQGMLINTMIGLRLVEDYDADPHIRELFDACFPHEVARVIDVAPRATEPW